MELYAMTDYQDSDHLAPLDWRWFGLPRLSELIKDQPFGLPSVVACRLPRIRLKDEFQSTYNSVIQHGYFSLNDFGQLAHKTSIPDHLSGDNLSKKDKLELSCYQCFQGDDRLMAVRTLAAFLHHIVADDEKDSPFIHLVKLPCLLFDFFQQAREKNQPLWLISQHKNQHQKSLAVLAIKAHIDTAITLLEHPDLQRVFVPVDTGLGDLRRLKTGWLHECIVSTKEVYEAERCGDLPNLPGIVKLKHELKRLEGLVTSDISVCYAHLRKHRLEYAAKEEGLVADEPNAENQTEPEPESINLAAETAQSIEISRFFEQKSKLIKLIKVTSLTHKDLDTLRGVITSGWRMDHAKNLVDGLVVKEIGFDYVAKLKALDQAMPWFSRVTNEYIKQINLASALGQPVIRFSPVLILGEPGIGKSRYIAELLKTLDLYAEWVACGTESTSANIAGTSRGYATACPGIATRLLGHAIYNNAIVFDELDKPSRSDHNGNFSSAILALLEPQTAKSLPCQFLQTTVDASGINIIATANSISAISAPLLSRFVPVLVSAPQRSHYPLIIKSVLADLAEKYQVHPAFLPSFSASDVEFIASNTRSIREVVKVVERMVEADLQQQLTSEMRH